MAGSGPLDRYNEKRDFRRTPEPKGDRTRSASGRLFIVQKHDATRLHWDFRLEVDGVLKSWAVTRGPSLNPDVKRLAVRTEDHPLAYADFEGTIPKGEYGGGTIMLWDKGTWEPVAGKDVHDLDEGHLHFRLHGERIKGEWLLVRMKGKPGDRRENWLLRKIDDSEARNTDALVSRGLTSVRTGRSMAEIAADQEGTQSRGGKSGKGIAKTVAAASIKNDRAQNRSRTTSRTPPPAFEDVQLATLVDAVPAGNGWMHEIKFDGYRALVAVTADKVVIHTRSGLDWTEKFKPLADALGALGLPPALIDGEIVALDKHGNPSFSMLQQALKGANPARLAYFAFDLLSLAGKDLKALPNIERKARLAALLGNAKGPIRVADHVIGAGEELLVAMCKAGQEGIISKRIDAPYRGTRTRNWVKVKCTLRQEFVIIGWSQSSAKERPFASLLLAQMDGDKLVYKGKVGTGFDGETLADLATRMAPLERKTAPAEVPRNVARGTQWISPKLVAEVAFAEFTVDGCVRHGSFIGLREDKAANQVTQERPAASLLPGGNGVTITNADRVIFDGGGTKGDLADYYRAIAPLMLPFAGDRPASLVRCPQGQRKKCFFQKHDSGSFGAHVHHVPITEKDGGAEDYLYVSDVGGILACVQMGTIEFHGWGAKADDVEHPDRMIFDLDPDEGLGFDEVKRAAQDIRRRLEELGLVSFAMLSGGKGVHVIVPLVATHDWEAHKDFSKRFAEAMSIAEPDRFVATMSKAKRKGRIFIDWLRNQRGSTVILPYSARARPGAPVAAPVGWDELEGIARPDSFSIGEAARLLERARGDDLKGWGFAVQALPQV